MQIISITENITAMAAIIKSINAIMTIITSINTIVTTIIAITTIITSIKINNDIKKYNTNSNDHNDKKDTQ